MATGFHLLYRSVGGGSLGPGLAQFQCDLHVDNKGGVACDLARSDPGMPGEAIGRFFFSSQTLLTTELLGLVKKVGLADLRPPKAGGPFSTNFVFEVTDGDQSISKMVNSNDAEALELIQPLRARLERLTEEALTHPTAAIRLECRYVPITDDENFELLVSNIGDKPLVMANPSRQPVDGSQPGGVRWSELPPEVPGVTWAASPWQDLRLISHGTSERIFLEPKQTFKTRSERWLIPDPLLHYRAQAHWASYQIEPTPKDVYLLRGGAFSRIETVTPYR